MPNKTPGRPIDCSPRQSPVTADNFISLQTFRVLGLGSQSEEICATTYSEAGFRDRHPGNDSIDSLGENEEDPTRCS